MSVFRTKSVEAIQAGSADDGDAGPEGGQHLSKRLSARHLIGFGIGIVIGTGIFTLTGVEAKNTAGPAVVISYAIAGVVALLAALCYAELASSVPTAGSAYSYTYATIGEVIAWIIGWDLLLEFVLGCSTVARGWSSYLGNLLGLPTSLFGEEAPINVGAIAIVAVLTVIAVLGIQESARVTNFLVLVKVAVCVFVVVTGIWFVKGANLTPFVPPGRGSASASTLHEPLVQALFGLAPTSFGLGGIVSAAAVVFFSYTGFEAIANLSEETKRPSRDLPLGLLGSLGICTVLYIGVSFVVVGMVKYGKIDEGAPIADAFDQVGLGWASTLISIAAVAGLTSVMLVELVTVGRIGFAMSRDGLLPAAVGRLNKSHAPVRVTIGAGIAIAVISGIFKIGVLADLVSIGALSAFVLVSVAVPLLRRTRPGLRRSFRVPLSPVLPIVSALACFYLMLNLTVETWVRFLIWLVLGLLIYAFYGYRHSHVGRDAAAARGAERVPAAR